MTPLTHTLADLEPRAATGRAFARAEAERVATCRDLVSVGLLGEAARRHRHGARVTFGRVLDVGPGDGPAGAGEAGEIRLTGAPAAPDEARRRVRGAAPLAAAGAALTGFALPDLADAVGGDHLALADLARALRADGLEAVAEAPVDRLGELEHAVELVRAVVHGGLGVWRLTVHQAPLDALARLDLIELAAALQRETGAARAFAPLPRVEARDEPSTGYDDVRTVAAARLVCAGIGSIQVDWRLHGPKLAQVAIAYGADDLDAVPAADEHDLGRRRSTREDLERQIRAAFAEPAERTGRYEPRP